MLKGSLAMSQGGAPSGYRRLTKSSFSLSQPIVYFFWKSYRSLKSNQQSVHFKQMNVLSFSRTNSHYSRIMECLEYDEIRVYWINKWVRKGYMSVQNCDWTEFVCWLFSINSSSSTVETSVLTSCVSEWTLTLSRILCRTFSMFVLNDWSSSDGPTFKSKPGYSLNRIYWTFVRSKFQPLGGLHFLPIWIGINA